MTTIPLISIATSIAGEPVRGSQLPTIPKTLADAQRWLDRARDLSASDGGRWIAWPDQPDFQSFYGPYSLNTGAAGLAWQAMHTWRLTSQPADRDRAWEHLNAVVQSRERIADHRPLPLPGTEHGYYGGTAGVSAVVAVAAQLWPDRYREAAELLVTDLLDAQRTPGVWTGNMSLLGDGGIALALLDVARRLERSDALDAARAFGDALLAAERGDGSGWPGTRLRDLGMDSDDELHGFELGNEGTAFVLASLAEATGDTQFGEAAERALAPVLTRVHTVRDVSVIERHDGSVFLGYCTGVAGLIRAVAKVFQVTGRDEHLQTALNLGRGIVASTPAGRFTPGNEYLYHQCCGTAGRLEVLTGLFLLTGDDWWLQAGAIQVEQLLSHAITDEHGSRWYSRAERLPKGTLKAEIGHQAGSSGIMLALARYENATRGREAFVDHRLPDDPFVSVQRV